MDQPTPLTLWGRCRCPEGVDGCDGEVVVGGAAGGDAAEDESCCPSIACGVVESAESGEVFVAGVGGEFDFDADEVSVGVSMTRSTSWESTRK